jgi:hypothetical protein
MAERKDIDSVLRNWPYTPGDVRVRTVRARDGREVLQMRVDLGVLQMETSHRPDGERPGGAETYLDFLMAQTVHDGDTMELTPEQCIEVDREFMQYYHRRICWLALREFDKAVADADHTLALMDYVKRYSPDDEWTISHEQYRPFVLFHRTQAAALAAIDRNGPEAAIGEINAGLEEVRKVFEEYDAADKFDDDEMVQRLNELRETLRERYSVGKTLHEQLAEAVAAEEYELAAKIRDKIAQQSRK